MLLIQDVCGQNMKNDSSRQSFVFFQKLNSKSSIPFAIAGYITDCFILVFCSFIVTKTLDVPISIFAVTILVTFFIVLIKCAVFLHRPEWLKKYDTIPEPQRTVEQINAMLYVCEKQPYIIDNFSNEMHTIIEFSSDKKLPTKAFKIIVSLYKNLMDGDFDNVPCCINELITLHKESTWTTK